MRNNKDYSKTGTSSARSNQVYVSIRPKSGCFYRYPEKTEFTTLKGFITSAKLEWNEGNAEYNISPHFLYRIDLEVMEVENGENVIKNFILQLPWHYQWAQTFCNYMLGIFEFHDEQFFDNDKFIWFETYPPKKEKGPGIMFINIDEGRGTKMRYQWNPDRGEHGWFEEPVPMPIIIPGTGIEKDKRNNLPVNEFWLEKYFTEIVPTLTGKMPENEYGVTTKHGAYLNGILARNMAKINEQFKTAETTAKQTIANEVGVESDQYADPDPNDNPEAEFDDLPF